MESQDPKELVRSGYDNIAPSYFDFISSLPSPNITWTDTLIAALPSPNSSHILELGCGNGIPCTAHLAPKAGHITANDISSSQIALAKEKLAGHDNITFQEGDMATLIFPDTSFDAVSALYSLIHLPLAEQPTMLELVHTWLKPFGLLLCNFDVEADSGSVMDDWLGTKMFKAGHGVEGSKQIMQAAGFSILEAEVVETVDGKKTVPFLWLLARKVKSQVMTVLHVVKTSSLPYRLSTQLKHLTSSETHPNHTGCGACTVYSPTQTHDSLSPPSSLWPA